MTHRNKVKRIQTAVLESKGMVSLQRNTVRHTLKDLDYKKDSILIDVSDLNKVIEIDKESQTVTVEPGISMEQLFDITSKEGFRIPVIPEFKGITVGGSILGLAGESSCFKYGLFHESSIEYEIVTGSGEVLHVSKENHSDLFYALPGSYGSLGILVSVKLKMIPCSPVVEITLKNEKSIEDLLDQFKKVQADFIDAINIKENDFILIIGRGVNNSSFSKCRLKYFWSPFYFDYVEKNRYKNKKFQMSLKDYLFRYDRGSFWVASQKLNRFQRLLLAPFLGTDTLYAKTLKKRKAVERECRKIFQDIMIPNKNVSLYLKEFKKTFNLYPLWVLPIRSDKKEPYLFALKNNSDGYTNIGSYGVPAVDNYLHIDANKKLEKLIKKIGGRKTLYSQSYYDPKEFWNIYDEKSYKKLRNRYHCEKFIDVYDKACDYYNKHVKSLQADLKNAPKDKKLSLLKDAKNSHTLRNAVYKKETYLLPYNHLNEVLSLDIEKLQITVQPNMTMKKLMDSTLPLGLMPKVLPEFESLTVGGLIQGAGLESSSFKFGQFNDCCTQFVMIDGMGNRIITSPNENKEFFYGIAGSYGSLGILESATIQLIPVKPFVELNIHYLSLDKGINMLYENNTHFDFLEGVLLEDNLLAVIEGKMVGQAQGLIKTFTNPSDPWFYKYLESNKGKSLIETLPLYDYLFRYDRGCFWTGRHAIEKLPGGYNWFNRYFFNNQLTTKALYARFHTKSEVLRAGKYFIQDCYLPQNCVKAFIRYINDTLGIYPLWLCPIKGTKEPQKLSPHFSISDQMINVGIYGKPKNKILDPYLLNREIEKQLHALGGRKMFYAYSFYTEEEFWKVYDFKWYYGLKEILDPEERFLSITDKVLLKVKEDV